MRENICQVIISKLEKIYTFTKDVNRHGQGRVGLSNPPERIFAEPDLLLV